MGRRIKNINIKRARGGAQKMKKDQVYLGIMRIIVILTAVLFIFSVARAQASTPLTQAEAFSASLKLNQNRFDDLNLIKPGEIVLVQTNHGVLEMRAEAPVNNRYDCVWHIVTRGLQEAEAMEAARLAQIHAQNVNTVIVEKATVPLPEEPKSRSRHLWLLALLPAMIFGQRWNKKRVEVKHNPDTYPPVGPNLTEAPMAEVIAEIEKTLEPGFTILEVERGYLERSSGPEKLTVTMKFGDGKSRTIWLYPGENICRARIKNRTNQICWRWFRSACTNGMSSGPLEHLQLPHGWRFVRGEKAAATFETEASVQSPVQALQPTTLISSFVSQMEEDIEKKAPVQEKAPVSVPKRRRLKCRFHRLKKGRKSCRFKKHLRGQRNRRNHRLSLTTRKCQNRHRR